MSHHFAPNPEVDEARLQHAVALKRWTRELLGLDEQVAVTVSEHDCRDPGCPLTETVVTVFAEGAPRQWSFTRPKVALTRLMLQQTLATAPRVPTG